MGRMLIEEYVKEHRTELLDKIVKILKANVRGGEHKPMNVNTIVKRLKLVETCSDPDISGYSGRPLDTHNANRLVKILSNSDEHVAEKSFQRGYGSGLVYLSEKDVEQERVTKRVKELLEQGANELTNDLIDEGLLERVTLKDPNDPESGRADTYLVVAGTEEECCISANTFGDAPYLSIDFDREYKHTGLKVNSVALVPFELELMGILARFEIKLMQEKHRIRKELKERMDRIKERLV